MNEEKKELAAIEDEPRIVHFPAGNVPIDDVPTICDVLNWGEDNGFELAMYPTVLAPAPQGMIRMPGQQGPQLIPALMFYFATDETSFQEYFGVPYSMEVLHKIPQIIEEKHRPPKDTVNRDAKG